MSNIELSCPNCNAPVTGSYCYQCGQRDVRLLRPVWSLVQDAMGDLFAFDSRFYKTLGPLFFKPGSVTKQFMQGKRARFVPPFRQYLVVSIIFFLTLALSDLVIFDVEKVWTDIRDSEHLNIGNVPEELVEDAAGEAVPIPENAPVDIDTDITPETGAAGNELEKLISAGGGVVDFVDLLIKEMQKERVNRVGELTDNQDILSEFIINSLSGAKRVATDPVLLNRLFADWIPKLMFVMLPFFALLLKLVYIRRKKFYIEHLVFSLHFHAFVFLLLTFMVLIHQYAAFTRPYLPWLLCYVPVYLLIAMWREYDQGPIRTVLKGVIVGYVYFLVMGICLSASILYGLSQL